MSDSESRSIEELVRHALECLPDLRASYLDEACRGDEDLRREVESRLQEDETVLRAEATAARVPATGSTYGALTAGSQFGSYEVVEPIGAGGMGDVYRGRDTKLRREVALKVLPAEFALNPERLARFEREARLLATLNHPHITVIHELEEADGMKALVLELVEGDTLSERIKRGQLPIAETVEAAYEIALALEAAHAQGVLHRDLKPSNIKLTPEGQIKVLDFGLAKTFATESEAKELTQALTVSEEMTQVGAILGTLPYMSPEQCCGKTADHRSDIWAFGCVLYEMLTGVRAFGGETTAETAAGILKSSPDWDRVPTTAPSALKDLAERCLSKNHEDRPASFTAARAELEEIRRQLDPRRRNSTVRLLLTAALLLFGVGLGSFLLSRSLSDATSANPPKRGMIAVLPFENLGDADDEYFAEGMTEEIRSRLAALDNLGVIARSSTLLYKDSQLPIQEIGSQLGVDYLLTGTVRWQRAPESGSEHAPSRVRITPTLVSVEDATELWAGDPYEAVLADIFDVQAEISKQVIDRLGFTLRSPQQGALESQPTTSPEAYDIFLRAESYANRGRSRDSGDELRFAIDMYDEAIALDPNFALAHARKAAAHTFLYDWSFDHTDERLALAKDSIESALAIAPTLPAAEYVSGMVLNSSGDFEGSLQQLRKAVNQQPNNADIHFAISKLEEDLGMFEESLASGKKAVELNPNVEWFACWTGGAHSLVGDYDGAIDYHDRAIRLAPDRTCHYYCEVEVHLFREGPDAARQFLASVPSYVDFEQRPSIAYYRILIEIIDRSYPRALEEVKALSSPLEAGWHYFPRSLMSAQIHDLMNEPEQARAEYESAQQILEEESAAAPDDHRFHTALGLAYAGLGQTEEAIREAALAEELIGHSWTRVYVRKYVAMIYVMVGDFDRALEALEENMKESTFFPPPSYLRLDPAFDPLRADPRFEILLQKYTVESRTARTGALDQPTALSAASSSTSTSAALAIGFEKTMQPSSIGPSRKSFLSRS